MGQENTKNFTLKSYEEFIQFLDNKNIPLYLQEHKKLPSYLLNKASIIKK